MNGKIPLVLFLVSIFGALLIYLPTIIFMLLFIGFLFTIVGNLVVNKFSERIYPLRFRVFEKRGNYWIVIKEVSGKEVKDRFGRFWFEFVDGKRIKRSQNDDEKKIKGRGFRDYINIVRTGHDDYRLLKSDMDKEKTIITVSDGDKEELYNQMRKIVDVTKPPLRNLEVLAPIILVGVFGVMMTFMIISFMQEYPKYAAAMQTQSMVMDKQIQTLDKLLEKHAGVKSVELPPAEITQSGG